MIDPIKEIEQLSASIQTWNLVDQPPKVQEEVASIKQEMNAKVEAMQHEQHQVIKEHLERVLKALKHEQG